MIPEEIDTAIKVLTAFLDEHEFVDGEAEARFNHGLSQLSVGLGMELGALAIDRMS